MATKGKKPAFRDHAPALRTVLASGRLVDACKVILVYGSSEYLLNHTVDTVRRAAVKAGFASQTLEAPSLNEATMTSLTSQASLFEPASFYLLRRVETAKNLAKLLRMIGKPEGLANRLCLIHQGEAPAAALLTELARLEGRVVPCFDPWPNELPEAVQQIAGALGLKLAADAVQLLIEINGTDLVKHRNELAKLDFLIADRSTPLTAEVVAPHLGLLREDDTRQLEQLLLQKQGAKAHALSTSLLARGEKPLSLLAILTSHCRHSLRIGSALASGQPVENAVRFLPSFVVKTYAQHLGRSFDRKRYAEALEICAKTDVLLKSTPISEELLIGRVIDVLVAPRP